MADDQDDYKVGPGRPPLHTHFQKGQSGQPRRPPMPEPRQLDAADEEVVQNFVGRIRQQILVEIAAESIEAAGAKGT